ncbi:MAG: cell wall-active antibiotics response protein [Bacteroidetes bacterium]|nr:cell wall-active antibiotics response protein [Bacteroidota bacterium]
MKYGYFLSAAIIFVGWNQLFALIESRHREYPHTREEQLRVEVELSFGEVQILKGGNQRVAIIDYEEYGKESQKFQMSYQLEGTKGVLRITLKDNVGLFTTSNEERKNYRKLTLCITDRIPVEMDVAIGAGKCSLNLSYILLETLKLSTGASTVELWSEVPNKVTARIITIESGVGKFTGRNLANLNFQELNFEGGVGAYTLDFDGALKQYGKVNIEVGIGSVTLYIPTRIQAKIKRDGNWLSGFRISNDFEKHSRGHYQSKNFVDTIPHIDIKVESGIGSVSIKQK